MGDFGKDGGFLLALSGGLLGSLLLLPGFLAPCAQLLKRGVGPILGIVRFVSHGLTSMVT